ncbi:Bifunctional hemolysin/adenylate cyclase [Methylobacterium bullatum]|uniref:Bifunctional hemolysin/adenylate cyclase n=1 Tax=Methylobacterium bullatum TaxID=570505 RepID=A0A679IMS2_9HYPH|nr:Bifunctional hemolysin/adenylate cyclase [Methylobacterium bullatum]
MALFRFTYEGNYTPDNSDPIFNFPMASGVRSIDFGPGTAIDGYESFEDSFIYVFTGLGFDADYGEVGYRTQRIGVFGDASDFAYTTRVTGGDYGDVFRTGAGDDVLNGGGGNDTLEGGRGRNTFDGGTGNNTLSYEYFDAPYDVMPSIVAGVTVVMESGSTEDYTGQILVDNFTNISNIRGTNYEDVINGDKKNNVIEGGAGPDHLSGGNGQDTLSYQHSGGGVKIDLSESTASGGDALGDQFEYFENLLGSASADELYGDANDNVIEGGLGVDVLFGDEGNDTLSYRLSSEGVTVDLLFDVGSGGDAEGDTYSSFENLIGSMSIDVLDGTDGANTLNGNGDSDFLNGRGGNDRLVISDSPSMVDGGADMDLLFINAGQPVQMSSDTFKNIEKVYVRDDVSLDMSRVDEGTKIYSQSQEQGGATIIGTDGNDRIQAGKGDDTITGGKGGDSLFGGAGADTFVYTDGDGRDVIRTFDGLTDTLDVSSLAASMDDMTFKSYRGGTGIVITFENASESSDKIILLDVAYQSLTDGNFLF